MTVSLAGLPFRRPARPAKAGLAASRARSRAKTASATARVAAPAATATVPNANAAAAVRFVPIVNAARRRGGPVLVALTPIDSLLADESQSIESRRAEGRAERLTAARTLLISGIAAGMLVATALTGITVMVAGLVRSFAAM